MPAREDRVGIPRFGLVTQVLSAFENQDAASGRRKGGRDRGAPHARSDDDHIRVWQTRVLPGLRSRSIAAFGSFQ
jgi:hypothetical protein